MYRSIDKVTLKNGERAELGVVRGPDEEWGGKLRRLLGHKGERWNWQIEQNLGNPSCGAESYFYILSKDGVPFANIMTVENFGIGAFGHVYTTPEERRKGAAGILQRCQMEDFKARGGRALYLGTGYDTHPYRLYQKYGFVGCEPQSGAMFYFRDGQEAFEAEVFAAGSSTLETFSFPHWPLLPALAMMRHPAKLRILGMGVTRVCSTEGGSLPYLHALAQGESTHDAQLAVSKTSHVPVAIACKKPETHFGAHVDLLDIFAAPGHEERLPELLERLDLGKERKALCYADDAWPEKSALLERTGFRQEGLLERHFRSQTHELHDVTLWTRG